MEYLSERITNISDLEKLLENINIKAQVARKSACISDIQALASDIASLSEKAAGFEFKIEKRKVNSPPCSSRRFSYAQMKGREPIGR